MTAVGASLEILVYSELQSLDCQSFCCLCNLHFLFTFSNTTVYLSGILTVVLKFLQSGSLYSMPNFCLLIYLGRKS